MNAIIGLCHFCEAHGPRPLFCTFTTEDESNTTEPTNCSVQCNGCSSLGPDAVYVSREENGIIFCSRESVANADVTEFLRQAAMRSITCEVSWSKKGGVVYFSDTRGHVVSFTFQLRDTHARGLQRWFSIVVLMKDKMLLLNIMPFLSDHMQKISKELQQMAEVVFNHEQKICSQRALRLNTGRNDFGQSRSLLQLTSDENVFKKLHSHFTWMLKTGALRYSEKLFTSEDLINKLKPQSSEASKQNNHPVYEDDCISLRDLENMLSKTVFRITLYCVLVGVHIRIKLQKIKPKVIINSISRLVPVPNRMNNIKVLSTNEKYQLGPENCLLEETGTCSFHAKWSGTLPNKCPTLMHNIENSMSNTKMNDAILHQHVKSLHMEWLGVSKAVKAAIVSSGPKSDAVKNLKSVFSMTEQDDVLVKYWISAYCD